MVLQNTLGRGRYNGECMKEVNYMGRKFLREFFRKNAGSYLAGIALMLISTRIRLYYPEYVGDATDYLASGGADWAGLSRFIYPLIAVALISFAGAYVWRYLIVGNARKLQRELSALVFSNFQELSQSFYNKRKTGDLIAYNINDVNAVRMAFGPALIMSINGFAMISISTLGMVQRLGGWTTFQILAPIPVVVVAMVLLGKQIRARFRKVQEAFGSISDRVNENINGIRVIKAYVQEDQEMERFMDLSQTMALRNLSMVRVSGLLNPMVQAGFAVSYGLFFMVCGPLVVNGTISLGDFTAVANYLNMMLIPVMFIGRIINVIQRGMASMGRLDELLDYPHEITDGSGLAADMKSGQIDIVDLDFMYPGTEVPVLRDLTIHLPNGKSLGILGETGSGKTTLVNLLMKVYNVPDGKIFLDGQDINDYTLPVLLDHIGYVPQDNFLFHDTIDANIRFFKDIYTRDQVIQAAKDAHINKSIAGLPDGYDTILGERGVNLSGGQKQRISIARALIRHPMILILDDALSAVDTVTEAKILARLRKLRADRTTVIVAHRISAVMACDEILVLDENTIRERGTHEELLERRGLYFDIYNSQYKDRIKDTEEADA
ncbi:putative multidrug resistance ABC transporter ATP-binding/permease protein YheI [anaerobic digester metagenome]